MSGVLFTVLFDQGCLTTEAVSAIRVFTHSCSEFQYYGMVQSGSVACHNLQVILKIVTTAVSSVASLKKIYAPLLEIARPCRLRVQSVTAIQYEAGVTAMDHIKSAFQSCVTAASEAQISPADYNNGATTWTNLFSEDHRVEAGRREQQRLAFHAALWAQTQLPPKRRVGNSSVRPQLLTTARKKVAALQGKLQALQETHRALQETHRTLATQYGALAAQHVTAQKDSVKKMTQATRKINKMEEDGFRMLRFWKERCDNFSTEATPQLPTNESRPSKRQRPKTQDEKRQDEIMARRARFLADDY